MLHYMVKSPARPRERAMSGPKSEKVGCLYTPDTVLASAAMNFFESARLGRVEVQVRPSRKRGYREPERSVLEVREHRKRRCQPFAGRHHL